MKDIIAAALGGAVAAVAVALFACGHAPPCKCRPAAPVRACLCPAPKPAPEFMPKCEADCCCPKGGCACCGCCPGK